jgi:hypothetical protein
MCHSRVKTFEGETLKSVEAAANRWLRRQRDLYYSVKVTSSSHTERRGKATMVITIKYIEHGEVSSGGGSLSSV